MRIAQRHWSEGEMGAFFCTDDMPIADKLSRCLLPQRVCSTVLQERLLAGWPAGARRGLADRWEQAFEALLATI